MSKNNADLLRTRLRAERSAMPLDLRQRQSHLICQTLQSWIVASDPAPTIIAAFWPLEDEPDLKPLLTYLTDRGMTVVLPTVVKRHTPLAFYQWTPQTQLTAGSFGVMEPSGTEPLTPDLLLVPTLGFTSASDRLGYGGGYYDRTLAALHTRKVTITTIGIAWSEAQLDAERHAYQPQSHDYRLDAILTGQGWIPAAPVFRNDISA